MVTNPPNLVPSSGTPRSRRRPRCVVLGLVLLLAFGVVAARPGGGQTDWVLLRVVATGDRPAFVDAGLTYRGEQVGDGALVGGRAFPDGVVTASTMWSGEVELAVESAAASHRVRIIGGTVPVQFAGSIGFRGLTLAPGESRAILAFHPGGQLHVHEVSDGGARYDVEVVAGGGSTAIAVADDPTTGVAASAGFAAAGKVTHTREVAEGLVGAFLTDACLACTVRWFGPDEAGSASTNRVPYLEPWAEDFDFRGPGGTWTWAWTGVRAPLAFGILPASAPEVVAWAPIGEHWRLFDQ